MDPITLNGRTYRGLERLAERPVVIVCIDGCAPEYLADGLARGILPNLARFREQGYYGEADCVIPSFTNPNNLSIVTGAPPAVHGISGNFFLDPDTGEEVMMNEPRFLRSESLLARYSRQGGRVAVVTAKDKLRRLLGHGLSGYGVAGSVCFSAEQAHEASREENGMDRVNEWLGRDTPDVYSAALSEFVMEAGVKLLREGPEGVGGSSGDSGNFCDAGAPFGLIYLSTTDYIQHKHAPGEPESDRFYRALDAAWGALADAGAVVGLTADHGMNAKNDEAGAPRVIHLSTLLDEWLGPGRARVILPITDPYVAHHGALGSFATVYLESGIAEDKLLERLRRLKGIEYAAPRDEACARFELPPERLGDLVVVSEGDTALGKSPGEHDLSQLAGGLRSHGGLAEQRVPFVLSAPLNAEYSGKAGDSSRRLRNFDLFEFAINGTV